MTYLEDYEKEYRKREIERYEDLIHRNGLDAQVTVPVSSVVKLLAENLHLRARLDYLTETILRHDFTVQQSILVDPVRVMGTIGEDK